MATLTKTYSGDLTSAIADQIGERISAAGEDAHNERLYWEEHIKAQNLKTPDRPFDPQFRKQYDVLGHKFGGGDFFGSALRHQFTPNPMGLLGKRFHKPFYGEVAPQLHLKSQSTPFASPIKTPKPTSAVIQAKLAGQPFPNVAGGAPLKYQKPLTFGNQNVKSQTPFAKAPTTGMSSTKQTKPVVVKDQKLGKFLAAVSLSLSASLSIMGQRLDEADEGIISVRDGIDSTIKKLEYTSDTLEDKLDKIIDALKVQVGFTREKVEDAKVARKENDLEDQNQMYEGEVLWRKEQDRAEFEAMDARDEAEDSERLNQPIPDPWEQPDPEMRAEEGAVFTGPNSGYPVILDGTEAVVPINNDKFKDGVPRGKGNRPSTSRNKTNLYAPQSFSYPSTLLESLVTRESGKDTEIEKITNSLAKTIELPAKVSGIVTMSMLSNALVGMGGLTKNINNEVRNLLLPVANAFGIPTPMVGNVLSSIESSGEVEGKKEEKKDFNKKEKKKRAWWDFLGWAGTGEGGASPLYRGGSNTTYRGGSNTFSASSRSSTNIIKRFSDWWNLGRNLRVPMENTASPIDLLKDDAKQITRGNRAFKSGATGIKGWRPWKAFSPNMVKTGPTPAVRQAFERPVRAVKGMGIRGGLLSLIINDLMNPQSLADGTIEGNREMINYYENLNKESENIVPPESRHDKSNIVNMSSLDNETAQYLSEESGSEPVILNNIGSQSSGQPMPLKHISNVGDSQVKEFYPRVF